MDNGPLWSQDPYGNYWLLFPNKHALAKDEIKEIFTQFGNVKMITESGDEKGFRFVQYGCLDDVRNAVDNLKDHPQVKLIPYRPKNTPKINQNSNVSREDNTNNHAEKRNFFQRKPMNNYNLRNDNDQKSIIESITVDYQNLEYESNYDKASVCSSNASNYRTSTDVFSNDNNYNNKSQIRSVASPILSTVSMNYPVDQVPRLLQLQGRNSNTFSTNATNSRNAYCDYEDELPDLVTASNIHKQQATLKKVIYNADEVIVANIPDNYGSAFILHLFEQFEPLAISYIKIAPKNDIRYCHVYFKSVEDSMGVETMFDKYDLSGKNLVVLRPCNLREELAY